MREAGNVYLPEAFYLEKTPADSFSPPRSAAVLSGISRTLKPAVAGTGHINVFVDDDGKVRSIPLFIKHDNRFVPHLAVQLGCRALGLDITSLEFKGRQVVIDNKFILPVSGKTSFLEIRGKIQ